MKTVKILLAGCDRRANNLIEATLLDLCYPHAMLELTRRPRATEFVRQGCYPGLDLIIVSPDHLLPEPARRTTSVGAEEAAACIREVERHQSTPLIAVNVSADEAWSLLAAGADRVLPAPLNPNQLKTEVRWLLKLPEEVEQPEPSGWSLAALFFRIFGQTEFKR